MGLTSMRATASYSYEGLVAAAIEPFAADHDGVSGIGCESRFFVEPHAGIRTWDLRRAIYQLKDITQRLRPLGHHGQLIQDLIYTTNWLGNPSSIGQRHI